MAGLMCQDADDLAGVIGLDEQTRKKEYPLTARDKGIEGAVIDDMDRHGIRGKTSRSKHRRSEIPDHAFRFRVANQAQILGERRSDDRGNENGENEQPAKKARHIRLRTGDCLRT